MAGRSNRVGEKSSHQGTGDEQREGRFDPQYGECRGERRIFLCQSTGDLFSSFDDPGFPGVHWIFCCWSVAWIASMTGHFPFVPQDKLVVGIMFFTGLNQEHLGELGKRHGWLTAFPVGISAGYRLTDSAQTHFLFALNPDLITHRRLDSWHYRGLEPFRQ